MLLFYSFAENLIHTTEIIQLQPFYTQQRFKDIKPFNILTINSCFVLHIFYDAHRVSDNLFDSKMEIPFIFLNISLDSSNDFFHFIQNCQGTDDVERVQESVG